MGNYLDCARNAQADFSSYLSSQLGTAITTTHTPIGVAGQQSSYQPVWYVSGSSNPVLSLAPPFMAAPAPSKVAKKERAVHADLAWLDRRVNEMRVRL